MLRTSKGLVRAFLLVWVSLLASLVAAMLPASATFPGGNGRIAFVSDRDGNPEIYTMNPDGTDQSRVTNNDVADSDPSFSQYYGLIAFVQAGAVHRIWSEGRDDEALTGCYGESSPSWGNWDQHIVFARQRGKVAYLYGMSNDGRHQRTVYSTPSGIQNPVLSPDGTTVAFGSFQPGMQSAIWVIEADGENPQPLTVDGNGDARPSWSPDGSAIAFESLRDGNREIYVMNADGSGEARLTVDTAADTDPAWAPDGNHIAFVSDRGGTPQIYVMNADGSQQTEITTTYTNTSPDWQSIPTAAPPLPSPRPPRDPPICRERHSRIISFELTRHLTAAGQVTTPDGYCATPQVEIQRHQRGRWKTIATVSPNDDGYYEATLTDRPGMYRAKVLRQASNAPGDPVTVVCTKEISEEHTHRH